MMSKSELIQKIADDLSLAKKDVKAVIESLATVGHKEMKKAGVFLLRQVHRREEAGHQGALGHQSVH
jgi:nucleoid DNA-binding protein